MIIKSLSYCYWWSLNRCDTSIFVHTASVFFCFFFCFFVSPCLVLSVASWGSVSLVISSSSWEQRFLYSYERYFVNSFFSDTKSRKTYYCYWDKSFNTKWLQMLSIQNVLLSIECHYLIKRCQMSSLWTLVITIAGVLGLNFSEESFIVITFAELQGFLSYF